jgi:hypothetical protein
VSDNFAIRERAADNAGLKQLSPPGGTTLDFIHWHRGKAGTIELACDVLIKELAGWRMLPSQRSGTDATWLHLNVTIYHLLQVRWPTRELARLLNGCASSRSNLSALSSVTHARLASASPMPLSPTLRRPALAGD